MHRNRRRCIGVNTSVHGLGHGTWHDEAITSELCEKYTILTQCAFMNVTGEREDMKKEAERAILALDLPSPPSHSAMLRMLREEATIMAWMDSHESNRKTLDKSQQYLR